MALITDTDIKEFFSSSAYAVVGASADRHKYGNKVLRCYLQHHKRVWPVHPIQKEIEGLDVIQEIADLPPDVQSISVVTPPSVTERLVEEAAKHGIKNIWMQPGAESADAIAKGEALGLRIIANGPCVLAVLGFHE